MSDRISLLPDSLLEDILGRLPLQEVVRTSVLSKRWIFLWTQLQKLVFDKSFCTTLIRYDKNRLKRTILDIVSRSRKPIQEFLFSLNGLHSSFINELVTDVCRNGVEYFTLEIPNRKLCKLSSFDKLWLVKRLTLKSCLVKVPSGFRGFTMVSYINFYNVDIDGGELSDLVASCPLLETLTLKDLQCCSYIFLVSPNLRVFSCTGFYLDICLEYIPQLESMEVSVYDTKYDVEEDSDSPADIVVPFRVILAIKYVALDGSFLMYMNAGVQYSRCQNILSHLKVIKLTDVPLELKEVAQNVLWLIRRSPYLETIVVTTCTEHSASDLGIEVWQTENLSDISLNELRKAFLLNINKKKSELQLIEVMLAKSPMLEKMVIRLHNEISEEEGSRIGEEIRQFNCASSQVEIILLDSQTKVNFQGCLL